MRRGLLALIALLLGGVTAAFAANPTPPVVTTGGASAITTNAATVAGSINPGGAPTSWNVEYGTSTGYGLTTPTQTLAAATTAQGVSATLSRLTSGTTYHYRFTATNAAGVTHGGDRTFRTATPPQAPAVATRAATGIGRDVATLNATVDANGRPTKAYFEYGTTRAYGQASPLQDAGSATSGTPFSTVVGNLAPNTTYHFRVVASSAIGTVRGGDRAFTTGRLPVSVAVGASPDPVTYGRSVTIEGRYSGSGVARRAITLQATPFPFTKGFRRVGSSHLTDTNGVVRFTLAPFPVTTRFRLTGAGVTSAIVTVDVRPSIRLTASRRHGGRVRVSGTVRPGAVTGTISIQRRTASGRWVLLRRVALHHRNGEARYAATIRNRPGLRLRAAYHGERGPWASAHSRTHRPH